MKKRSLLLALALASGVAQAAVSPGAAAESPPAPTAAAEAPREAAPPAAAVGAADESAVDHPPLTPVRGAMLAAAADGATTLFGVASRALVEGNGLAPSSPLGIVVMTTLKVGAGHYADGLEPATRAASLKAISSVFGGAAVNNALLIATAHPAIAVASGLASAVWFWRDTGRRLEAERLAGEARLRVASVADAAHAAR